MSKLIGTNPNQVPSNADLGTAAFMDKKEFLLSKGSEMSAIEAVISKTAVDVFIYDTTKDSDGGAWRKRVQHTSWYNERLNTTTRGSRKEFPAVAVIVAESTKITIYDADDPTLPMWMVFYSLGGAGGGDRFMRSANTIAIHMLNSQLVWADGSYDLYQTTFINEDYWFKNNATTYTNGYSGNISNRNVIGSIYSLTGTTGIVNRACNDVAMTVLPNAPIDADTGLPVPTIAVATDGGISIIKDDGAVVDIDPSGGTQYNVVARVKFVGNVDIAYASTNTAVWYLSPIPSTDTAYSAYNDKTGNVNRVIYGGAYSSPEIVIVDDNDSGYSSRDIVAQNRTEINLQTRQGLNKVYRNISNEAEGLSAVIKQDYNTGWMPGDNKLATLSDTDATNAVGAELITNSTSFSNTTGWYLDAANTSSGTIATIAASGGNLVFTHSNTNNYWDGFGTSGTFVVGKTYTIDTTIVSATNMNVLRVTDSASQHDTDIATTINSAGTHSFTFVATATTMYFHWNGYYTTSTITLSKFSVRLAEEDRSVNNNGLQVFGTVTKTAVATGADLVAYSGFSASNYLQQPYNSNLDFGTGDVSAMGWFKLESTYVGTKIFFDRADPSWPSAGSGQRIFFGLNGNDYLYYYTDTGNVTTSTAVTSNVWTHACFVRSGTSHKIYMNGALVVSNTHTASNLSGSTNVLTVGNGTPSKANPWPGSLALWRISATAPSEEQIKKMYEDEKMLFQDNAKATLYGTSNTVTALAYDDSTELLHVGTSAGRSDFHGLRRINNTTRAIGTAISAVDGFIVEE